MTGEMVFIVALMVAVTVLFVTEWVSFDIVALLIMGALMVAGVLTVKEGLSGLSDGATVSVAALFVLSGGLYRTGALEQVTAGLSRLGRRSQWLVVGTMMAGVVVLSALFHATPVVVIFIPVLFSLARQVKISPSKLLIPLSFAAQLGGTCTLIGHATNLLVSSFAQEHGQPAFGMFELSEAGLLFSAVGVAYMLLVGVRLVPARRSPADLSEEFEVSKFLTDITLGPESELIGRRVAEAKLPKDLELLEVFRRDGLRPAQGRRSVLQEGDVLRVRGSAEELSKLLDRHFVSIKPSKESFDVDFKSGATALVEVVISPEWGPLRQRLSDVDFLERFGAVVLAIRHGGVLRERDLGEYRLSAGDSLLLQV